MSTCVIMRYKIFNFLNHLTDVDLRFKHLVKNSYKNNDILFPLQFIRFFIMS